MAFVPEPVVVVARSEATSALAPDDDTPHLEEMEGIEYVDYTNCYVVTLKTENVGEPDDELANDMNRIQGRYWAIGRKNGSFAYRQEIKGDGPLDGTLFLWRKAL